MVKEQVKSMVKTGVSIAIIYIVAVILSLFLCDRIHELESREDIQQQNNSIVLQIK